MPPWIQVSLTPPRPEQVDPLSELFSQLGALSVTLGDAGDEPVLEPGPGQTPIWGHTRVTALFEGHTDPTRLKQTIGQRLPEAWMHTWSVETLEDQVWERAWMEHYHPMGFGDGRLWVLPHGAQTPAGANEGAVLLRLDPGLAFGTGTHPTTALCLEWLAQHARPNALVVDYGCGSGILAIASALLGAERIIAVDNDPQALEATRDNAERNRVTERIETYLPHQVPPLQADLLLANILAGPLVELAPTLIRLIHPAGDLVLSGILEEQADGVTQAYQDQALIHPPTVREEWVRLTGTRR